MANFLKNLIENDKKELKRLEQMADKIELLAEQMSALSDEELRAKTEEFRNRYLPYSPPAVGHEAHRTARLRLG